MKANEIITKTRAEIEWVEAKLAAIGYPGIGEVEVSVKRALGHLREKVEAAAEEKPDDPGRFYQALVEYLKQSGPRLAKLNANGTPEFDVPPDPLEELRRRIEKEGPLVVSLGADDQTGGLDFAPPKPDPAYTDLVEKVKADGPQLVTLATDGALAVEKASPAEA